MSIKFGAGLSAVLCLLAGWVEAQTPVSVVRPVRAESVETLRFSGNLVARESARLSPQVAGLIAELEVDVGDRVETGQTLLQLDARLAELEVARAEAARAEARAALDEARRLAEEGRRLVGDRFLPDTEVRARESAAVLAEAGLARAEAELATEQERLRRHSLDAPFSGVIAARLAERGEWVGPGVPVLELVRVDELWLDVQVPQRYWVELGRSEALVRAHADVAPDSPLETEIQARVPVSDPTARTFLLRLLVHDRGENLMPGMSARVEVDLKRDQAATLVPRDALLRYPDGSTTVWIVPVGSDRASQRPVTVRRFLGDQVELDEELGAEARVVVRGNEVLSEGEVVRVVEEPR